MKGTRKIFCLDVECAATSKRHSDRTPISVAVVNEKEEVLLHCFIKPKEHVFSYLTPLTGATEKDVSNARSFDDVVAVVRQLLRASGPLPLVVGCGIANDARWLKLVPEEDFSELLDLSEMFKAWNPKYGQYNKFSLAHLSRQLLQTDVGQTHSPEEDAILSIRLYKKYKDNEQALDKARNSMIGKVAPSSFAKRNNYQYDGVCMAAYYPQKCICDAPSLK
jgi:RNA exonuclease 4